MSEQDSLSSQATGSQQFPFRIFWTVLLLICLALALSAALTFKTLIDLQREYLRSRGYDVVAEIQKQTRGPGRHNNPGLWQEAFEDALLSYSDTVAFISLLDGENRRLAHVGAAENVPGNPEFYSFEFKLEMGRGGGWGMGLASERAEWHIEIGLYSEQAQFIGQQARVNVIVASIAVFSLFGLAFYFARTLKRFLILKNREESEKHLAALGAMSATLAHEIRNPLAAMKGLTQLVQEDLPESHRSQELMGTVVSEAERLEQLVSDLLTFARPAELRLTDFDLAEVIQETVDLLGSQAKESGVGLHIANELAPTKVHSDRGGIRQVLLNLILNAVEASSSSGKVKLSLELDARHRQATIKIEDEGPGLGDQDPEQLFQPFKTTKVKGSGLGLAVSRQIVERLGGRISLENSPKRGTLCIIQVPIRSS